MTGISPPGSTGTEAEGNSNMAQRKPPSTGRTGSNAGTTGKAGPYAKPDADSTTKPGTASAAKPGTASAAKQAASGTDRSPASAPRTATRAGGSGTRSAAGGSSSRPGSRSTTRPPAGKGRKPGKSIVNQKQRPWGLIAATALVVVFAIVVVGVVIATRKTGTTSTVSKGGQSVEKNDPYRQPALAAAMKIKGVTYRVEADHTHVTTTVKYDSSPPVGGDHSQIWAQCTGVVYTHQLANENAVHMLEHGAIWVTYNPKTLSAAGVKKLAGYVQGQDRLAMTPYAGLKTPISLQAWGYQLFLTSPTDPRIAQFIAALKYNKATTPEYGASCSDPAFKPADSTPGHPQFNA